MKCVPDHTVTFRLENGQISSPLCPAGSCMDGNHSSQLDSSKLVPVPIGKLLPIGSGRYTRLKQEVQLKTGVQVGRVTSG